MPAELGSEGPLLGGKVVGSERREVRIHPEDMFHHVYILGQTGTGKTTMLGSMMDERLTAGAGLGLIDPHGDLCDKILRAVPDERRDDVILFDPSDPDNDVKLNLLEYDPRYPRQRTTLINELFQIFDQEYDLEQTGGPMFETYMRNALRLVMDDPEEPGTLLDAVNVFQDDIYRAELLDKCTDESVVNFWEKEAEKAGGEISLENITPYVTSKLNRFLFDEYLRGLIDVRHSTINFRDIIDDGKILLIKMTKGKLGELGVRMFGTIIFTRLLMAALSREDLPEEERQDFFLFVDEFQNFTTPTVASMLSEARKYRLSLTLANQSLFQLEDEIVNAVLGNVGSLVTLRPGVEDYDKIGPYVTPPFEREEIINLPSYTAVARLLADRQPTKPFTFQTIPVLDDDPANGSPAE
jgi:type IV secretory pathway TraG/TraD family ATPase VirD4